MKKQTNSTTKLRMTVLLTRQLLKRFAGVDGAIIIATHADLNRKENNSRNSELCSALYASHYSTTPIKYAGGYIFVVANTAQHDHFFETLNQLGINHSQLNVLSIRANRVENIHQAQLGNAKVDSTLLRKLTKTPFDFECQMQAEKDAVWNAYENAPTNWLGRWACSQQVQSL